MGDDTGEPDDTIGGGLAVHIVVFVAVNLLLIGVWALFVPGASLSDVPDLLTDPSRAKAAGFFPIYVLVFWGAALFIHAGVVLVGAPRRIRQRRAKERQRRKRQAGWVGALGDGVLADAAVAGITLVDGEKAAKKVKREAARRKRAAGRSGSPSGSSGADGRGKPTGKATTKSGPNAKTKSKSKAKSKKDKARTESDVAPPTAPPMPAVGISVPVATEDAQRGSSSELGFDRHWVAVMFTDIVDSTPLNQKYGDQVWADLLATHRTTVRRCIAAHGGVEVGTQGDSFLVRFDHPDDAAVCAIALQRVLDDDRLIDDRSLHVRIGIHAGEAVQNDDDLVGRVVNLASRVTGAAAADEILVTEPFADHLADGQPLVDRGLKNLKGFDQPRHLLALVWRDADEILLDR